MPIYYWTRSLCSVSDEGKLGGNTIVFDDLDSLAAGTSLNQIYLERQLSEVQIVHQALVRVDPLGIDLERRGKGEY